MAKKKSTAKSTSKSRKSSVAKSTKKATAASKTADKQKKLVENSKSKATVDQQTKLDGDNTSHPDIAAVVEQQLSTPSSPIEPVDNDESKNIEAIDKQAEQNVSEKVINKPNESTISEGVKVKANVSPITQSKPVVNPNLKYFKRELLKCPACHCTRLERRKADEFTCPKCERKYEIREGIPFLLTDLELVTQLEQIDYDQHHRIDVERRLAAYDLWEKVFHEHETGYGDVLEIGSGTGQLTWSLINRFPFSSVHAVDISYKFLKGIQDNLVETPGADVSYTVCDANNLPYNDGKFDLVIGHSVLHHFVDYDKTIGKVRHLLRKGGQAIFFEPVLQGKIWVAFFADLMLRIENNTKPGILDTQDKAKLKRLINHLTKAHKIGDDREALSKMEDKYIFDINKMRKLSAELGYQSFAYSNSEEPKWGFRDNFIHHLLLAGISSDKIQKFTYMNNSFGETFSNLLPEDVKTPMGFFVFKN